MNILEQFTEIADKEYDGHFTILKFTSNYGACFGTLIDPNPLATMYMAKGKTLDEALKKAINEKIDCYKIDGKIDNSCYGSIEEMLKETGF